MFSRYLVIFLALVAAVMQATRGAWMEAAGLIALAVGLVLLRLSVARPALRRGAYAAFVVTVLAMVVMLFRRF